MFERWGRGGESSADQTILVETSPEPLRFDVANPAWHIETVDAEGNVGAFPTIALDSGGRPHVFYGSGEETGDMKEASREGSTWTTEVIVSGAHIETPLSGLFDGNDILTVSYTNSREEHLMCLTQSANTWTANRIPMDSLSYGSSLGLSSTGEPRIAFTAYQAADSAAGTAGHYQFYQTALNTSGAWDNQLLFSKEAAENRSESSVTSAGDIQLAVDGNDHSHIIFFDGSDIRYSKDAGPDGVSETLEQAVATADSAVDIAVDQNDRPHVVYADTVNQKIRYAVKETSGWTFETVDEGKSFGFVGLALDGDGSPQVVFTDTENGDLLFARREGGIWVVQLVDSGEGKTGWYPSIAVDPSGNVHIAYQDFTNQDLKFASLIRHATEINGLVQRGGGNVTFMGSRGLVHIDIQDGTFTQDVQLTLRAPDVFPMPAGSKKGLTPLGVGLEIRIDPQEKPARSAVVTIPYSEDDVRGQSESRLTLAYYDAVAGDWVAVPTRVNTSTRQLTATCNDFALLQIMIEEQGVDVVETRAYPNPFRPSRAGHDKITFDNLPAGAQIKIYTMRGALVRELSENGSGTAFWDARNMNSAPVASGVYLVRIQATGGDKVLKVAVQR